MTRVAEDAAYSVAAEEFRSVRALVSLRGVAVAIGRTPVLGDVDLTLGAGEAVALVGANGSGKSTLLQVCATLRRPHRGQGQVLGADLRSTIPAHVRRQICLIGHQSALYPRLSLRENLAFVADLYGRPQRLVDQALGTVGLARAAERRADQCSAGMLRRADLARVLLTDPRLLLLDEAHSGLDSRSSDLVGFLMRMVQDRGGAVLITTHDLARHCGEVDHVVGLSRGRLRSDWPAA